MNIVEQNGFDTTNSPTDSIQDAVMTTVTPSNTKIDYSNKLTRQTQQQGCLHSFVTWPSEEQTTFVRHLITHLSHVQHGEINRFLQPIMQRDFISALPARGLDHIAEKILSYLDFRSLSSAQLVCKEWYRVTADGGVWRKLIERMVRTNSLWYGLAQRKGWLNSLFRPKPGETHKEHMFYRHLFNNILEDIQKIDKNWRTGNHTLRKIACHSVTSKGVYCLQYDDNKIVCGLRDNTIKVWNKNTLECTRSLRGHTGSVLCLQFSDDMIISGSSDATVRVWSISTGEITNILIHHSEAVLHLRYSEDAIMVTCSKDRSIAVWDIVSAKEINLKRVLLGHRAAVNVVDFDLNYIVSASGDRTIKVWNTQTCEFVRTLVGHKRGIACLQYRDKLIVSGSSDNTIRLWDVECGACLRALEGHEELVRCIRFDNKRIVSGAYDGKIKVWDLQAALDPRSQPQSLCLKTLIEHTGRVFRLQFDEFQIVSSSHDDTIIIWDFMTDVANPSISPTGQSLNNSMNADQDLKSTFSIS